VGVGVGVGVGENFKIYFFKISQQQQNFANTGFLNYTSDLPLPLPPTLIKENLL